MSICATCTPWCATTEQQLANRLRKIKCSPHVGAHPCRSCGGVEWATTGKFVVKAEPRNWLNMTWREKTWGERAQTVLGWILVGAAGAAMLGGALHVLGMMIDQNDRRSACMHKAGDDTYQQRRC